jgi:hypothetical protein
MCGTALPKPRVSFATIFKIFGCLGLLAVLAAIALPGFVASGRASNDRCASSSIKTLATAEADFRANDRDGNHINDYWTGDVAGLYCIAPGADGPDRANAIKLIEISMASADSDPLKGVTRPPYVPVESFTNQGAKAGYWYWALRADASVVPSAPYRQEPKDDPPSSRHYNTSRFGFIAYPDNVRSGRAIFIINEGYTMFKRPNDEALRPSTRVPPGPITRPGFLDWPSDAILQRNWERMN